MEHLPERVTIDTVAVLEEDIRSTIAVPQLFRSSGYEVSSIWNARAKDVAFTVNKLGGYAVCDLALELDSMAIVGIFYKRLPEPTIWSLAGFVQER